MIYLIIVFAVASRFVTHIPNFAPITALAIFSAAYLPKKQAIAIPLAARFVSDLFLGFFQWPLMVAVYASHLFGLLLGFWIKKSGNYRWLKIVGSSVAAALVFFLVTNFAFFYPYYSHDWSGVMSAYVNGLPFLKGTLMGDVFYTVALFGSMEAVRMIAAKRVQAKSSGNLA